MAKSRAQRIFDNLEKLGVIDLLKKEVEHQKLEQEGYMPLSFQDQSYYELPHEPPWQNGRPPGEFRNLSLEHHFIQNGDLCVDPRMDFRVDLKNRCAEALTFEMAIPPVYQSPYQQHARAPWVTKMYRDINAFALQWTRNLLDQGFRFDPGLGNPMEEAAPEEPTELPQNPAPAADSTAEAAPLPGFVINY